MNRYTLEFEKNIKKDIDKAKIDFENAYDYIKNSSATFTRGVLSQTAIPKFFDKKTFQKIKYDFELLYSILDKIIKEYQINEKYRNIFLFEKKLQELILVDCHYSTTLPIARLDMFLNEDDLSFKFCEFNTDGASAMNEDREIYNAWKNSNLYKEFGQDKLESFELFDSWVDEFISIFDEWNKNTKQNRIPTVAIVDFLDIGTKSEFTVFKEAFERRGIKTVIAEITKLKYIDGKLFDENGFEISAVYRRAVTSECMDKYDTITDFLQAYKDCTVCVIGAFRTQVVHDKNLFWILKTNDTKKILTKEENQFIEEHVPKTFILDDKVDFDDVLQSKDKWLIKPSDRYGSKDVATGGDYSQLEWETIVKDRVNKGYVLQEYIATYKSINMYFDLKGNPKFDVYGNMTGVFVYGGKVKGLYSRLMLTRVTTSTNEGRVACSLKVLE